MNSIHHNGKGDSPSNGDLDQIDRAYQHLDRPEPPELIDQAILNSAHRAVEKKSGWMQFGWMHGLTTSAVIVLVISLVWQQPDSSSVIEDSIGTDMPSPLQRRETKEKLLLEAPSGSTDLDSGDDEIPSARQRKALPASPVITENESLSPEKTQPRSFGDEPASLASGITYEEATENRARAEKKESPAKHASADEMDGMAEVVAKEVSHVTDHTAARVNSQQAEPDIIEQLARIIRLKEAGDDSWQMELQSFRQRYPDYPIPQELDQ